MSTFTDYIKWRGDLSFEQDPFNVVDNVVLSWLIYTDFDGAAPGEGESAMTLKEVSDKYFTLHTVEEVAKRDTFIASAPLILKDAVEYPRFGNIKVTNYFSVLDSDIDLQMAAMTFELSTGGTYVAFRGTDDTITGWKEDFDFSFETETSGQKFSKEYLDRVCSQYVDGDLLVGGHSKGGNFAVFASVFCEKAVKDRIKIVYSNDGPGFVDAIASSEQFKEMQDRIFKIVPESSIIGMLMSGAVPKAIVKSEQKGALQHDSTSWEVLGNKLVTVEQTDDSSHFYDETIKKWLDGVDPETRKEFINSAFNVFQAGGAQTLTEFNENKVSSVIAAVKELSTMDANKRKEFFGLVGKLVQSGASTLVETTEAKVSQTVASFRKDKDSGESGKDDTKTE